MATCSTTLFRHLGTLLTSVALATFAQTALAVVWAGLLFGSGGLCARLTNASEENENDFRLLTRRCRRCRIAVLLDLRPAAARGILAPKEPALDWVSSGMPTWSQRALQAETRMSGIAQIDTEQSGKAVVRGASLPDDDHATAPLDRALGEPVVGN